MKVFELIAVLQTTDPENEVVIQVPYRKKKGVLQVSTSCKPIGHIWTGIDWDHGKIFLQPKGFNKK